MNRRSLLPLTPVAWTPTPVAWAMLLALVGQFLLGPAAAAQDNPNLKRQVLERNIETIAAALDALDKREPSLADMKHELQELIDEVAALEIAPPQQPPPPKPQRESKKVPFRPPILKTTQKSFRGVIVCQNNRATVHDLHEKFGVPHFEVREGEFRRRDGAEHEGEAVGQIQNPKSELARALREFSPDQTYLQIVVYPDSYEVFRAVRERAWQRKFDLKWFPLSTGERIPIGGGGQDRVF